MQSDVLERNLLVEGVLEVGEVNFKLATIGPTGIELYWVNKELRVGAGKLFNLDNFLGGHLFGDMQEDGGAGVVFKKVLYLVFNHFGFFVYRNAEEYHG